MADDERLAAEIRMCWEYWQLDARLQRLSRYIRDVNTGDADWPDCPMWLLERQRDAMRDYRGALETRAELMGVDLYAAAGEIREAVTWDDQSPAFVSLREYGPDAKQRLRLADLVLDGEAMGYVPNNPGREDWEMGYDSEPRGCNLGCLLVILAALALDALTVWLAVEVWRLAAGLLA